MRAFIPAAVVALGVGGPSGVSAQALPNCGTVAECAQRMIDLTNQISEDNKALSRRITALQNSLEIHERRLNKIDQEITPFAIAAKALSSMELVVRSRLTKARYSDASCQDSERLVGGTCVGGNPNYSPAANAPESIGDGGQAAVGPFFVDKDNRLKYDMTSAVKVICRAYSDPNMVVTAYAICMRPTTAPAK